MKTTNQKPLSFTLEDIQNTAEVILKVNPDPIPRLRLLREVIRLPDNHPELLRKRKLAIESRWVKQLEQSQLENGSWGRFHSQDTKIKTVFRTTEEAIDRAIALGLEAGDSPLTHVKRYIIKVLTGDAHITDRMEKNDSFPVLINRILAGRLAQIDRQNGLLDGYGRELVEIARQSFSTGNYRWDDEVSATLGLYNIHIPRSYLITQYALWILSSRNLPDSLDHALVNWAWQAPHGIGYLGVPLANPQPTQLAYWLRSMNLLARFRSWRELTIPAANWLWKQREDTGVWKFNQVKFSTVDFPLSDSWHTRDARQVDISTSILAVLRKYFD